MWVKPLRQVGKRGCAEPQSLPSRVSSGLECHHSPRRTGDPGGYRPRRAKVKGARATPTTACSSISLPFTWSISPVCHVRPSHANKFAMVNGPALLEGHPKNSRPIAPRRREEISAAAASSFVRACVRYLFIRAIAKVAVTCPDYCCGEDAGRAAEARRISVDETMPERWKNVAPAPFDGGLDTDPRHATSTNLKAEKTWSSWEEDSDFRRLWTPGCQRRTTFNATRPTLLTLASNGWNNHHDH